MSLGFEIPPEQVPADATALPAMIDFLNDANTGFNYSGARQVWDERGFATDVLGTFISFAQTTARFTEEHGIDATVNLTDLYKHWDYDSLLQNQTLTEEMLTAFNSTFWNERPERLIVAHSLGKSSLTILGGVPPILK